MAIRIKYKFVSLSMYPLHRILFSLEFLLAIVKK